ncbi:MAG TPA: hypothetical protein VGL61_14835 [Kofleriaceae bacterium]|jgi:hypothetical protein
MQAARASGLVELIVAAAATALLATARPAPPQHAFAMPQLPSIRVASAPVVEPSACWLLPSAGAKAYVSHRFDDAEALLSDACVAADAQLLHQMTSLWREAANGNVEQRYDALLAARAIDVSFGGLLAEEIDARTREVVAPFAMKLVAEHRYDDAETAIQHGKLLGIDMRVPEQRLARVAR